MKIHPSVNPFSANYKEMKKNFDCLNSKQKCLTVFLSILGGIVSFGVGGIAIFYQLTRHFQRFNLPEGDYNDEIQKINSVRNSYLLNHSKGQDYEPTSSSTVLLVKDSGLDQTIDSSLVLKFQSGEQLVLTEQQKELLIKNSTFFRGLFSGYFPISDFQALTVDHLQKILNYLENGVEIEDLGGFLDIVHQLAIPDLEEKMSAKLIDYFQNHCQYNQEHDYFDLGTLLMIKDLNPEERQNIANRLLQHYSDDSSFYQALTALKPLSLKRSRLVNPQQFIRLLKCCPQLEEIDAGFLSNSKMAKTLASLEHLKTLSVYAHPQVIQLLLKKITVNLEEITIFSAEFCEYSFSRFYNLKDLSLTNCSIEMESLPYLRELESLYLRGQAQDLCLNLNRLPRLKTFDKKDFVGEDHSGHLTVNLPVSIEMAIFHGKSILTLGHIEKLVNLKTLMVFCKNTINPEQLKCLPDLLLPHLFKENSLEDAIVIPEENENGH